ncbi:hypothetical protein BCV69DRAFT_298980 [Microstroma glucosiphilum]|uniref:Uncharacterized protein n=1 Tax=Pseudomicrostroma glucosiphilum TaxID=1684307 RepID=A0A316UDQ7_9BASI|nr:hypothetical protein BCV69DRAFT_298980 [Pseudomicrostroma glucosiphilum]PWN21205.1 hypothetical protein BCV69DRAFT_298980 [Pseudomicrostroma glucosiphilum]
MTQTALTTATLTIDDILADLAVLSGTEGSNSASALASGSAAQAQQQHPILSLGRSFVAPESLSRSEIASTTSSSSSNLGGSDADPLASLLEDDTTRLKTLLRSLEQGGAEGKEDISAQLEIVRLFLASSDSTLVSLNKSHQTRGTDGQDGGTGNEIENLHTRVARVQADLDQLERQLEAARSKLD